MPNEARFQVGDKVRIKAGKSLRAISIGDESLMHKEIIIVSAPIGYDQWYDININHWGIPEDYLEAAR